MTGKLFAFATAFAILAQDCIAPGYLWLLVFFTGSLWLLRSLYHPLKTRFG